MQAAFLRLTMPYREPHLLLTVAGDVLAANDAARVLLGLESSEPGDVRLAELASDDPQRIAAYLRSAAASGSFVPGALSFRANGSVARYRCDGASARVLTDPARRLVQLRLRPQQDASHRFVVLNERISRLAGEIRRRRRTEEELQAQAAQLEENALEMEQLVEDLEAQKEEAQGASRAKSEFLAVMSHELRTPLNAIIGFADLLDAGVEGALNDGQRRQLDRIVRGARHLVLIIDQILSFARLEGGREVPDASTAEGADVARQAAELIEPALKPGGPLLRLDMPDEPLLLHTDAPKVRQILLNLLANAIKFTERGEIRLSLDRSGEWALYRVSDTGRGIPPSALPHIFEPFWQAARGPAQRVGGTGLGLTVTRSLTALLGGRILVESEEGRGSTFEVRIPIRAPGARESREA